MRAAAAVAALICFALPAAAETPPAGSVAKAGTPADEVLAAWNEAARKVIAMAEDYPEAKYDFKPTPEVRSFAEQILHVAGGNALFLEAAKTGKFKEEEPSRATYKTKAQVVALLKKSVADDAAYIKQTNFAAPMKSPFAPKMMSAMAYWFDAAGHMSEHYGQLVFYYRMNKMVPPESRPKK
ncbi:MAG: DinB family protein [Polyangia bacterium]